MWRLILLCLRRAVNAEDRFFVLRSSILFVLSEFCRFWTQLSCGFAGFYVFRRALFSAAGEGDEVVAEYGAADAGGEILKSLESASIELKGAF